MSNTDRNSILATALAELTAEELADVLRLRSEIVAGTKHGAEPTWRVTVTPMDSSTDEMVRCIKSIREALNNGLGAARAIFSSGIVASGVTYAAAMEIATAANAAYHECSGSASYWTPFRAETPLTPVEKH
jgi:hypothetical protein